MADSCLGDSSSNSLCFKERILVFLVRSACHFVKKCCAVSRAVLLVPVLHNADTTVDANPRKCKVARIAIISVKCLSALQQYRILNCFFVGVDSNFPQF